MSDEQNQNDPLERLFRKKAEEYNISYKEEDWLELEKQLDARDMKLYYQRRLRWLAAASILILSLIGYYTVQNHNKINELTEQLNQNEAIQQAEPSVRSQEDMAVLENESPDQTDAEPDNSVIPDLTENETSRQQESDQSEISANNSEAIAVATEDESDQPGEIQINTIAEAKQIIQRKPIGSARFYADRSSLLALTAPSMQPIELSGKDLARENEAEDRDSDRIQIAMMNDGAVTGDTYSASSRLAVGVVVSPDLSTVGSVSNFYDPGFKGGLLAEYSLSKNISLISGVTISNVKYKADGRTYNPPQAWNYGVMPNQTTAVCLVLDIPLNLKVNLFNFDRSRIFATAGLSSYIMLNEDYQFSYEGDASGLQSSWNDRTGTRHWFSNAGFSVGIEYDLSPTWSIRAEPHLKVPLKGVGWGDVELYSMGSFISLNYRFGSP